MFVESPRISDCRRAEREDDGWRAIFEKSNQLHWQAGLAILVTVLGYYCIGEGLREQWSGR